MSAENRNENTGIYDKGGREPSAPVQKVEYSSQKIRNGPMPSTRNSHPSEVQLGETTQTILADLEPAKPARVVFDSFSEIRLLKDNPLSYRRSLGLRRSNSTPSQCSNSLQENPSRRKIPRDSPEKN